MVQSVESEFEVRIRKNIRNLVYERMNEKMSRAASHIADRIGEYVKFFNVTGNLFKSIKVGVYYKGELQSVYGAPGPAPTRPTLAKGEKYNLPKYYDGIPSGFSTKAGRYKKPFVGKVGFGGQTPEDTDNLMMYYIKPPVRDTWALVVATGIDYAQYVQSRDGHDVLTRLRDYVARYYRKL